MTQTESFRPGKVWLDISGKPIQAHGGCILFDRDTYYWFGENKDGETYRKKSNEDWNMARVDVIGISCYSSKDLINWKYEGLALGAIHDDENHDLHTSKVVERPKVVFNEKTGKYVLWVHVDRFDYSYARAGVAISDNPAGPYKYLGSFKPNGQDSRDMTVFKDEDGKAYLIHSGDMNKTTFISLLTEDYLQPEGKMATAFIDQYREAPAVFKHNCKYYVVSSWCTGWEPNEAQYAVADHVMGPWTVKGNPCKGEKCEITFGGQSTFVFSTGDSLVFMGDIWKPKDLKDSRYIWLPVSFEGENMSIEWHQEWAL